MRKIRICLGTCCHLMGGSDLYSFFEEHREKSEVEFELETPSCLDYCNQADYEAPIVQVEEKIYDDVTIEKLKKIMERG